MSKLISVRIMDTPDGCRVDGRKARGKNREVIFRVDVPSRDPKAVRDAVAEVLPSDAPRELLPGAYNDC